MIYPWRGSTEPGIENTYIGRQHKIAFIEQTGVKVYLEIDNRKCTSGGDCFPSANEAADFLAAQAAKHTLSKVFPIYQVRSEQSQSDDFILDTPTNLKYVFSGVVIIIFTGLLVGVLVTAQRKRAAGVTWFPEGFFATNTTPHRRSRRRGPDGQEMRHLNKNSSAVCMDTDLNNDMGHVQHWSDDESDMPQPKRMRVIDAGYSSDHTVITDYEEPEPRVWTEQHLDAAGIRAPPSMLTPPGIHDSMGDVNARGPCGMTPLMVAAIRNGGIDTGEEDDDDCTGPIISDLIQQGKFSSYLTALFPTGNPIKGYRL